MFPVKNNQHVHCMGLLLLSYSGIYIHSVLHFSDCLLWMVISKRISVLLSEELIIQKVLFKLFLNLNISVFKFFFSDAFFRMSICKRIRACHFFYISGDIIFNAQYPELPPDFIFGEDAEFLPDPSALHVSIIGSLSWSLLKRRQNWHWIIA